MPTDSHAVVPTPDDDFVGSDAPTGENPRLTLADHPDDDATDPGIGGIDPAPFGRSESGLPIDAAGQEWDMVTSEGHGFNDSDGPAQMRVEIDGIMTLKADWGPWAALSFDTFFQQVAVLDAAQLEGDEPYHAALERLRLRNANQWHRVCFTYFVHHRHSDPRFELLAARFGDL